MERLTRTRARIAALCMLIVVGITVPGAAAGPDEGTYVLDSMASTASWSGEFIAGAFGAGAGGFIAGADVVVPEACTTELCDVVPLEVQLPAGTWEGQLGGMLVAIQWPEKDNFGYDLDLFVYGPDGSLAASEVATYFSRDEAAWIENPVNGSYTVVVMPKLVASQPVAEGILEPLEYEGFVEFERGITVQRDELNNGEPYTRQFVAFGLTPQSPAVELLPDLVPTTPRNFHIESTVGAAYYYYGDRGLRHAPSCYPQETLGLNEDEPDPGNGPLRCLRWDQGEQNFGDGPFELHIYEGTTDVYQRIYSSDGSARQIGPLGEVRFSQAHGHFHNVGWQEIKLYRLEEDGALTFVKEALDKGICMTDNENNWFGRTDRPTSPGGYPVSGSCDHFSHQDPNDPTFPGRNYLQMGISVGYSDVYPWWIADQYIDITDVPDGKYAIVVRQDVANRVLEKSETNNSAMGCVEIAGDQTRDIPCL